MNEHDIIATLVLAAYIIAVLAFGISNSRRKPQ